MTLCPILGLQSNSLKPLSVRPVVYHQNYLWARRALLTNGDRTRAFPEVWWIFKTFISKLHNLFPSQSIFNLKAPR